MSIQAIRRGNLDVLKAEAESYEAIGEAMRRAQPDDPKAAGKNYANVLSQIKNGKNMGDKFARLLEVAMGKPEGWMDERQFDLAEAAMEAKEAAQIIESMAPEKRAFHMRILRLENESNPEKSASSPFGPIPKGGKPQRSGGTQ